ncbi:MULTISPECIES: ABC transporter ATP-binding protein [unclassified Rhizobium]|jgi:branched-chain amino acid transport system ATP-binding protein|uniref:ABC transporter ATP-binding protein n=1 Tax=unclassified Rhizobium TaxID=2613769 RepID=UPI0006463BCD|nr:MULTISPECIES: ABC transporter ATP-binding protein [unclassified Rhizobium]MBN8950774.1 ABC transporter ATP-binding protein [Rhizobium tropici]OJY66306.1 MAG: ABC transporter ATP-binding protein [Rhizobium sp. 60-20]RKD69124.1 amino acid/amide ABC transporter ATP-binding protein 2 (HAAT family) [Rhizobium sp. WW_1]
MTALSINGLVVNRSGIPVVRGVDLSVSSGEISVLLGSNGAGKTTLLESLSGIISAAAGSVSLDGAELLKLRAGLRARAGISHVEQGRTVFPEMTTEENLKVALNPAADLQEAYDLFPELLQRRNIKAGMLSGGEQQMVVIARSLLTRPKVIMIDEMSSGLAPVIVSRLMRAVRQLADAGMAVILVEQFAALALAIGDRAYVLRRGAIVYDGDCTALADDPAQLHRLYLGDAAA